MYTSHSLSVLAYADRFTLWFYRAPEGDTEENLLAPGYFDRSSDMLRAGDRIQFNTFDGSVGGDLHVVKNEGGTILIKIIASTSGARLG